MAQPEDKETAMSRFKSLKVFTKLMCGFALMGGLMAGVGYMGVSGMEEINQLLDVVYDRHALGLAHLREANTNLLRVSREVIRGVLDGATDDTARMADSERGRHAAVKGLSGVAELFRAFVA